MTTDSFLKLLLRVIGTAALFAVFAVVMPHSWMDAIHRWLGMGELPDEPIVGYLARSTSAFYALLGGLFWVVSFDLHRHRMVLRYIGVAVVVFGVALFAVDLLERMPLWWSLCEGPFNTAFGIYILAQSCRLNTVSSQDDAA